jgi:hypothetical protein
MRTEDPAPEKYEFKLHLFKDTEDHPRQDEAIVSILRRTI